MLKAVVDVNTVEKLSVSQSSLLEELGMNVK